METGKRFPCLEQPVRCLLSSTAHQNDGNDSKRLSALRNGSVVSSNRRTDREEWVLLPVASGEMLIKNFKLDRFLTTTQQEDEEQGSTVVVATSTEAQQTWRLTKSPHGGVFLTCLDSNEEQRSLACDVQGTIVLSSDFSSIAETWSIEFVSGELCFVSSPAIDRRIRCDFFGQLALTENTKGWEVWRFIEIGGDEGYVRITAWMHKKQYLCCDEEGRVSTVTDPRQEGTMWAVEKAPKGSTHAGVVIKSVAHDKILCVQRNEENDNYTLHGALGDPTLFAVWQLEAAHSQKYTLFTTSEDKSLGPFPYVTTNKRQTDEWRLEFRGDDDTVTLFSPTKEEYLGSFADGKVCLSAQVRESELWQIEARADGSNVFVSKQHGSVLSFRDVVVGEDESSELCTVSRDDCDGKELWRLDPCMPRAVSSGKIKTFAIGTTAAIATTIAMPFAVAGVVGLIGAEMGILANVVAVGLTGAEALASIGVVGTTAALVFRESSDSLSSTAEDATEESSNPYSKRPFCDWRLW